MKTQSSPQCSDCHSRAAGLFCDLPEPSLREFDRHKTTNFYKKGQIIFYEGNQAFGIFCIISGRIKLYKSGLHGRPQIVRLAGPGDLLGYRSLFASEPYHATAEAVEDSQICCIEKNAFYAVLQSKPDLGFQLLQKLSKELRVAEDLAASMVQKSARERMAELLLMLQKAYGRQEGKGIKIDLELSREEMAEMIGITQETAIRLLSDFKKEKMIEVQEREITIIDTQALLQTAQLEPWP